MVSTRLADISLDGVKGVLLDFDNTVYPYRSCHKTALNACFERFVELEGNIPRQRFEDAYMEARQRVNTDLKNQGASHSRLLYFQKFFEGWYGHTRFDLTLPFEELYWTTFMENMEPFPDAIPFLEACKAREIPVCVVTDLTAAIQFRKINHLQLADYFQFIVTSEEAGVEKPHAYMFDLALEKMKRKPGEVIMVGDNIKKDIPGAEMLGIKAYLVEEGLATG